MRETDERELSDDEIELKRRIIAERQVEAFLGLLETKYNLKSEDIPELLDNVRWISQHRANSSRLSWNVALGLLSLAVAGLGMAVWEGIKQLIRS